MYNDLIFHSSLHKQRLWNLLKRFQFDEKQHLEDWDLFSEIFVTTFSGPSPSPDNRAPT